MKCDYLDHVWSSILIIFVNLYFIPELMKAVPFLKESAEYVARKYNDLQTCCIVLPSNRSVSAFKNHLVEAIKSDSLLPDIKSIDSFMEMISFFHKADNTQLLMDLYQIQLQIHPNDPQSLQQFTGYAEMLQRDFNDIDISLANADSIFNYLLKIREMESEFDMEDNYGIHKKQIEFCKELPLYYHRLKDFMEKKGIAYQGMQYRYVAEHLEELIARLPYQKYLFVGFSALSLAEESIVCQLFEKGMAEFIVDDDAWYMEPGQAYLAGKFLNSLKQRIPLTHFPHDYLHQIEKEVQIWGLPQETAQADCLPELLEQVQSEFVSENQHARGVIVLLQENMLLPVLYAIPQSHSANISMEYALPYTTLYELLHLFWVSLENRDKFPTSDKQPKLYHKDVSSFLGNALLQQRFALDHAHVDTGANKRIFYTRQQWEQMLQSLPDEARSLLSACFFKSDAETLYEYTCQLLDYLLHDGMPEMQCKIIDFVKYRMLQFYPVTVQVGQTGIKDLRFLWEKMLSALSFPFESDHQSQLQINGMLETRAMDFDYVIVLSANEGVIPNARTVRTLIPFDVRKNNSLPTFQNHEAIMTYHFYRLLQRAEKVYLLYNMDSRNEIREKSRLLHQLALYWKEIPNVHVEERHFPLPQPQQPKITPICVKKDAAMLSFLQQFSYSPSSINVFLACPLQFCLQYIYRLPPMEETDEMIQANTMGSVIHKILEQKINPKTLQLDTSRLKEELVEAFQDPALTGLNLTENDICHEKNLLVLELCRLYLKKYLDYYRKKTESLTFNPVQVAEQRFSHAELFVWEQRPVCCSGCIDRADMENQTLCIIDYKTGHVNAGKLKLKKMEEMFDGKHKEALQLMLYMHYKHVIGKEERLQAKIIALQHPEEEINLEIASEMIFEEKDFQLFVELFNHYFLKPLFDMTQKFEPKAGDYCDYCPYTEICNAV